MNAHRFDPISAVLAVVAVVLGVVAISGIVDPFQQSDVGIWIAVAVIGIGLALIPWSRRKDHPVGED